MIAKTPLRILLFLKHAFRTQLLKRVEKIPKACGLRPAFGVRAEQILSQADLCSNPGSANFPTYTPCSTALTI